MSRKLIFALALAIGFQNSAHAAAPGAVEYVGSQLDGALLTLSLRDRFAVSAACDYYVTRFEYVESAALVLVDLASQDPCPQDRVAKREGKIIWTLPTTLRGEAELGFVVNQQKFGRLEISGTDLTFYPAYR
jgi:hypothetical protein